MIQRQLFTAQLSDVSTAELFHSALRLHTFGAGTVMLDGEPLAGATDVQLRLTQHKARLAAAPEEIV